MELEYWYPTIISYSDYKGDLKPLVDACYDLEPKIEKGGNNWISNVYNTHSSYDILKDDRFKNLNEWVLEQANMYCKKVKSTDKLKFHNSWFTIYRNKDFQEYHTHPGSTLSAIFMLKADPEKCARTIFESDGLENVDDLRAEVFHKLVNYKPTPGRLLLFRSTLRHCVEQQKGDEDRISVAYNFGKDI